MHTHTHTYKNTREYALTPKKKTHTKGETGQNGPPVRFPLDCPSPASSAQRPSQTGHSSQRATLNLTLCGRGTHRQMFPATGMALERRYRSMCGKERVCVRACVRDFVLEWPGGGREDGRKEGMVLVVKEGEINQVKAICSGCCSVIRSPVTQASQSAGCLRRLTVGQRGI